MDTLRNHMRIEAEKVAGRIATTRIATVTSYDPAHYAIRATIQPEGVLTGWIPLKSPWVGNGWGLYAPPSIGDAVELTFQEGVREAGMAGERFYSALVKPLPVPSGEFWVVHQSGSLIKFHNDGSVIISANGDLRIEGNNIKIHGRQTFAFDANGQGQKWNGSSVETWQDNDTAGAHHNHAPPETP